MSNFGGPNSKFEKDFNFRFKRLDKNLKKIENNIQNIIYGSLRNANVSSAYWNKINRELEKQYIKMNATFKSWAEKEIPMRYRRSIYAMQARINSAKAVLNTAKKTASDLLRTNASRNMMNALWTDAVQSMVSASTAGLTNLKRITRATQQVLINESLVDITLAAGFETTLDLRKAAAQLAGQLEAELFGVVDKRHFVQAGKYKYQPSYYAELVARTKFHEAQSAAARTQAFNYGTDLIQVSSHNTTTVICQEFEGKIFSVSGKDKRFPALTQSSPYHPNCLHLEFPTFESAMKVQGTLKSFSAFSKGNINRPPVPSGFVPVGARQDLAEKAAKRAKAQAIIRRRTQAKALREGRIA